jgi:hypothetical protein
LSNEPVLEDVLTPLLEDGEMCIQAIAIMVCMDEFGRKYISQKRSSDLRTWEAKGMAQDFLDTLAAMEVARQLDFHLDEDDD